MSLASIRINYFTGEFQTEDYIVAAGLQDHITQPGQLAFRMRFKEGVEVQHGRRPGLGYEHLGKKTLTPRKSLPGNMPERVTLLIGPKPLKIFRTGYVTALFTIDCAGIICRRQRSGQRPGVN
jgi:hypothetical protein